MLLQQQRHAGRHGIAGLQHVLDELLRVFFLEAARHGIDNRRTALVDAEGVDILRGQPAGVEQLMQVRRHFDQGKVEHLAAVHEELAVVDL